jgi:GTP pyrophosphokinase
LTSTNQQPNNDWLKFVVSSRARSRIKKYLRDKEFESSALLGEEILTRALQKFSIKIKDVNVTELAGKFTHKDAKSLYAALGRGELKLESLLRKILPEDKPQLEDSNFLTRFIEKARKSTKGVRVAGMDNIMISFGKCCNPVPGEPITGIVSRGRGIVIHTNACKNLLHLMQDPDRIIDVSWDVEKGARFLAGVYILGERRNKFISDITEAVAAIDANIVGVSMNSEVSLMNCVLSVEVYDLDHLNRVITKLRKVPGVISVGRLSE